MTALHVVMVSTSWPLADDEASGVFVARLARAMAARVRVSVVTPADRERGGLFERDGMAVRAVRYAPRTWRVLAHRPGGIPVALAEQPMCALWLPALAAGLGWATLVGSRGADLIHAHWAASGALALPATLLRRLPLVTTLRGADVHRATRSPAERWLLAQALRHSRVVATVSDAFADALRAQFPRLAERIVCVPNGVDESLLEIEPPPAASPRLRLIAVGSLIRRKRVDRVLQAMAALPEAVSLEVVGEGPERRSLEALVAELGLRGRVHFAGAVAAGAVVRALSRADALVLTSDSEGRPNVVLEAMAAARAVVATDIAGTRELVEHGVTGLLVPLDEPAALAAALRALLEDPQRRVRMGLAGRAAIRTRGLTWAQTAGRYLALYERALRAHRDAGARSGKGVA